MLRQKSIFLFLIIILIPIVIKAEGQDGLVFILDTFSFLFAFGIWIVVFFLTLYLVRVLRKKENRLRQKIIVGLICSFFGVFHFLMIKSDPYPYEGPIDEIIHRDIIEASQIRDSLEMLHGKPDSTIEETIASIDKSKIGVYIWLNGRIIFVRKLTPELSQQSNDSLTMSIVRKWKK